MIREPRPREITAVDLDDIHEIDWSAVSHAYGPATDVPELLTSLARGENLKKVCWELWGNLFHQGTTYQASHVAVPFLWRILREGAPMLKVRLFLLTYLRGLARGYPEFPERPDPELWWTWIEAFEAEKSRGSTKKTRGASTSPSASVDERLYWSARSYFAVEAGLDAAIPLAESSDAPCALHAVALLSDFPRKRALVVPPLAKIASATLSPVRGAATLGLALLGEDVMPLSTLLGDDDRATRLYVAAALVVSGADVPTRAVDVLMSPLEELADVECPFGETLAGTVGAASSRLPKSFHARAVEALSLQHREAKAFSRLSLTTRMLGLAFPQGVPASVTELDDMQRLALETIVEHGGWTLGSGQWVNYTEALRGFGLPSTKRTLQAWLRGEPDGVGRGETTATRKKRTKKPPA